MRPMRAPSCDDVIGPSAALQDCPIIFWPNRVGGGAHLFGICIAPGKNIRHTKPTKPQRPGTLLTALNGGIVLKFRCRRWVEHNKIYFWRAVLPGSGQAVAIALAGRINGL